MENTRRLIYRVTPADFITISGGLYGLPPPRTVSVIDLINEAAVLNPSAKIIPPSPDDGVPDVWEVQIIGEDNFRVFLFHVAGTEEYLERN